MHGALDKWGDLSKIIVLKYQMWTLTYGFVLSAQWAFHYIMKQKARWLKSEISGVIWDEP